MLPKEKRRGGWSLAVGVILAGLAAGYFYLQISDANERLHSLVAECKKQKATLTAAPLTDAEIGDDFGEACEPNTYVSLHDHALSVLEQRVWDVGREVDGDERDRARSVLVVFLIFCLPLIWYLVLDRIREISAAIAGRDRSS
jgi:hypothetical protein